MTPPTQETEGKGLPSSINAEMREKAIENQELRRALIAAEQQSQTAVKVTWKWREQLQEAEVARASLEADKNRLQQERDANLTVALDFDHKLAEAEADRDHWKATAHEAQDSSLSEYERAEGLQRENERLRGLLAEARARLFALYESKSSPGGQ